MDQHIVASTVAQPKRRNQRDGDHGSDVGRVDEGEAELEGAPLDGHVGVLKALEDGGAVALHGAVVGVDGAQQRVQRHVADVLVAVEQEPAEDVDGQHAQPALRLDVHYRHHLLNQIKIRVPLVSWPNWYP